MHSFFSPVVVWFTGMKIEMEWPSLGILMPTFGLPEIMEYALLTESSIANLGEWSVDWDRK